MTPYEEAKRDHYYAVSVLCSKYVKPEADTSIYCGAMPVPHAMECMVAYRSEGWSICKYQDPKQEQQAFNLAAACFDPIDLRQDFYPFGGLHVILLPIGNTDKSDPLGMYGYVGLKRQATATKPVDIASAATN